MKFNLSRIKCVIAFFLVISVLLSSNYLSMDVYADKTENAIKNNYTSLNKAEAYYRHIKDTYSFESYTDADCVFDAVQNALDGAAFVNDPEGSETVLELKQGNKAAFRIKVPQNAQYAIKVRYYDQTDSVLNAKVGIQIDGEYPFYEMRNQQFEACWLYESYVFSKDRYGNETVPKSVKKKQWEEKYLNDINGITVEPFLFELSEGQHLIEFECDEGNILIDSITLCALPLNERLEIGTPKGNEIQKIEAEKIIYKNDSAIRPAAEYNLDITPYNRASRVMNMIDESSFSTGGQKITYKFTVEKSGYYYIGFNYRQSSKTDFPVFRNVFIDNQLSTPQFENIAFGYTGEFQILTVSDKDNNQPIGVYLEAEVEHELSLYVTLEEIVFAIDEVADLLEQINDLSMQITKITGNNTEKLRDFDLEEFIPNVSEDLNSWADRIETLNQQLNEFNPSKKSIAEFATLSICVDRLRDLAKKPNELPKRLSELSQGQSSVSQYLADTLENLYASPLSLDSIYLYQDAKDLPAKKSVFAKLWESICRFLISFIKEDYSAYDGDNSAELEIWVNRSRQYVEIMQNMADRAYQNGLDFKVKFSLMPDQNKLVLANSVGNTPDVALGVSYGMPFELAIRGAVKNLKEYDDWQTVASRFHDGLLYPGVVEDGLYALPETTNFYVLFYRTDIFEELGLQVPNTMQDVKSILPQLNRQGMNFFSHMAGYIGYKPFSSSLPFIYQHGGTYYGENAMELTLDSDETLNAINEMCELFTIYNIPYEVSNFYQHFRNGLLPVGVGDFGTYNLLLNTAPEIANSWDIALYPGYENENGEVLRYTSGASESCIIFDNENADKSWEFLKWWTSCDVQVDFANTLQLTYGKEYLWNTANTEAFAQLPWDPEHKKIIMEQLEWVVEAPRVPGNYMVEREISNALNSIVLEGENSRAAMDKAIKTSKKEISRKLEEFGYIKNGEIIKQYIIRDYKDISN